MLSTSLFTMLLHQLSSSIYGRDCMFNDVFCHRIGHFIDYTIKFR